MGCVRCIKTIILFIVLIMIIGCKAKQDKPSASSATSGGKAGANAVATQDKAVARPASLQDKADARSAAAHVLSQFKGGEFSQIYKESAPGFKQIGSEAGFVANFQRTRQKTGILSNPQELGFGTLPGNGYMLVYRLENDHFKTDMRLTFARSQSGKMELAGLNQHDELK